MKPSFAELIRKGALGHHNRQVNEAFDNTLKREVISGKNIGKGYPQHKPNNRSYEGGVEGKGDGPHGYRVQERLP
jgi:hypothetical protein